MNDFLQDFNIINFLLSNILWLFLVLLLGAVLTFIKSPFIARKILKNNRETLGNGYGKHLADVFVESWHKELQMNEARKYMALNMHSTSSTSAIQQQIRVQATELEKMKLVEIKEGKVNAIKNFRNKIVFSVVKIFLITFVGDNKQYYKDIKI